MYWGLDSESLSKRQKMPIQTIVLFQRVYSRVSYRTLIRASSNVLAVVENETWCQLLTWIHCWWTNQQCQHHPGAAKSRYPLVICLRILVPHSISGYLCPSCSGFFSPLRICLTRSPLTCQPAGHVEEYLQTLMPVTCEPALSYVARTG